MKHCTYCFRYTAGAPVRCPRCNRTFGHRWCVNQHLNNRTATVCQYCGSTALSTAAPMVGILNRFARWTVFGTAGASTLAVLSIAILGSFVTLDWNLLTPRLVLLAAMPYVVYRSTLVLPGPIHRALLFERGHCGAPRPPP